MKLNPRRTRREVDQTETAISELDSPTFLTERTDGPGAGGVLRADAVGNRDLKDLADEVRVGQDAHVALPAAVTLLDAHDGVRRQLVADLAVDGDDPVPVPLPARG